MSHIKFPLVILVISDAVRTPVRPSENSLLSAVVAFCLLGWICVFVCLAEGADRSVRGIVPFSPVWSRGFRDFEICCVEFISREQAF